MDDYKVIFEKISKVANNLNETMNELMETLKVRRTQKWSDPNSDSKTFSTA